MGFKCFLQKDAMLCGVTCLKMICNHYGKNYSIETLSQHCHATKAGVSLLGISEAAQTIGFYTKGGTTSIDNLKNISLPCILHWDQEHFVVLYKIKNNKFYIANPSKGNISYNLDEMKKHWETTQLNGIDNGIVLLIEPTDSFWRNEEVNKPESKSVGFLLNYLKKYKSHLLQILLGLLLGCILQLILPFLTQSIIDLGIKHNDIHFVWLVLLGELMIVIGRTATDFIRRWLLLHISMRINISLVSDFFIKLLKLPMSFFDTKLMGDLLQRINDHSRVQSFLTNQVLGVIFTFLNFIIFGIVLFIYNETVFGIFLIGSFIYGFWITTFLKKRRVLDYDLFEQQAKNQNKTYQLITSMQEIKLQDCEQRRRWEWEDTQANLFSVQMKVLKLQQTQEAGSIFINEVKTLVSHKNGSWLKIK